MPDEKQTLVHFFPKLDEIGITDDKDAKYNCLGWTVDQVSPTNLWPWYGSAPGIDAQFQKMDALYLIHGFQRVQAEPMRGSICVVSLFSTVTELTHVALRDGEIGWWESKLGAAWRVMHRIEDLEGGYYGNVVGYYWKKER